MFHSDFDFDNHSPVVVGDLLALRRAFGAIFFLKDSHFKYDNLILEKILL